VESKNTNIVYEGVFKHQLVFSMATLSRILKREIHGILAIRYPRLDTVKIVFLKPSIKPYEEPIINDLFVEEVFTVKNSLTKKVEVKVLTRAKVVSFDIWGTLLDLNKFYDLVSKHLSNITNRDYQEVRENMGKAYHSALEARLKGLFKRPVYDSAVFFSQKLGVEVDDLFKAVVSTIYDKKLGELPYSDSLKTLEELKRRGYIIALLGNVMFWPGMITRAVLHKCGLLQYVDITLFGDEIGVQKPDKAVFEELAHRANVELNEIIHVGDSLINDFAGALLAGVNAVLLVRRLGIGIIEISGKAYIVNSLIHLLDLLL